MALTPKDSAGFVFEGTVRRTQAANLKAITDKSRTVVVHVDALVRAPEVLLGHQGKNITVKLAKGERVKKGQKALFYTNGWIFGENLAVESVGHERVDMTRAAAMAAPKEVDPVATAIHSQIRQEASESDVVISGKVVAIGEAEAPVVEMARGASTTRQPVSEHDPFWKEAVIEVKEIHKGQIQDKRVVLRFPASSDVRWSHTPKFEVGHEGVFMLRRDSISQVPKVGVAAEALGSTESYTCLNPINFQRADCETEIAVALKAVGAEGSDSEEE